MFTAIRAETAHSPTYQLLRGEIKKRGGRSPGSGNQVIAGKANPSLFSQGFVLTARRGVLLGLDAFLRRVLVTARRPRPCLSPGMRSATSICGLFVCVASAHGGSNVSTRGMRRAQRPQ